MIAPPTVPTGPAAGLGSDGRYSTSVLEDNLDWLADAGELFLGCYVIGSSLDRCEGGQGLVQFCSKVHRKEEFAIKCELSAWILAYAAQIQHASGTHGT